MEAVQSNYSGKNSDAIDGWSPKFNYPSLNERLHEHYTDGWHSMEHTQVLLWNPTTSSTGHFLNPLIMAN